MEGFFLENLIWRFQIGSKILIGYDQFLSGDEDIYVPEVLLNFFHRKGFFFWNSLIDGWHGSIPLRKDVDLLQMLDFVALLWEPIRMSLRSCGIFRSEESDDIIWKNSESLSGVRVKEAYQILMDKRDPQHSPIFLATFWKSECPSKMIFFASFLFRNRNLS